MASVTATSERVSLGEYYAVVGSRYTDKDANIIGPELHRLMSSGATTGGAIVNAARQQDSPLHPYFDWDNAIAGEKWRQEQAKYMIRSIEVRVADERPARQQERVRAFYSVAKEDAPKGASGSRQYVTVTEVLKSPDLASRIIADAKAELVAWSERHRRYRAMFPSFEETFQPVLSFTDGLRGQPSGIV